MDLLHIRTSGGVFGFVGQVHTGRRRPALVAINGAFPTKDHLHDLVTEFRGVNVLVAYMPGMGPPWSAFTESDPGGPTLPGMTQGLGEAIQRLVGDCPLVVFGSSTGNLLALGLTLPTVTRVIASEPFFRTGRLEPFIAFARQCLAELPPGTGEEAFLATLFGIHADGRLEDRDYRHLAAGIGVPTDVVVGARLDGWRGEGAAWPSLTSAEDRALLQANPNVTLHVVGERTGHTVAVSGAGKELVRQLIYKGLVEASARC
ncbi:hypothetical protein [Phenylobacterium sp.]|uniref:alpha/beta fold hydrolase n=1 Tax=Phenylobacterium sp. TaxID=1871053 RepID=UPI0025E5DA89|nr:hypothetical protein [Phenylobacterium sp.]MBX3483193.1 hypothetical protein [Phenylobacterium sp.]